MLVTLLGAWAGKKVVERMSDGVFVALVEVDPVAAGVLFLIGF